MNQARCFAGALVALVTLATGCAGEAPVGAERQLERSAVTLPEGCESFHPVTVEFADASPRANPEAELLSQEGTNGVVASQALYDRVASDLTVLRAGNPEIAGVRGNVASHVTNMMLVQLDDGEDFTTFEGWNCVNAFFRVESIEPVLEDGSLLVLTFAGTPNIEMLAEQYLLVPGVKAAAPNHYFSTREGHPSTNGDICFSPRSLDSLVYTVAEFTFEREVTYRAFESHADGSVVPLAGPLTSSELPLDAVLPWLTDEENEACAFNLNYTLVL